MSLGAISPSSNCQTLRIRGCLPSGAFSLPLISNLGPQRVSYVRATSELCACSRRALASTFQASRVNPNPAKNRALLAPYRCSGLSKYSVIFSRSTTARWALGRRMTGVYHLVESNHALFSIRVLTTGRIIFWDGVWLRGKIQIGRATIAVLDISHTDSLRVRAALRDEGTRT